MEKYFDINREGCSVRCKIYCTDMNNIKRVVIFGHGFGGHKDNNAAARFADRMLSKYKNAAVITFDWPCHGEDGRKKLLLADCDMYLSLVIDYARTSFEGCTLYAYATSFGGYLTLKYIAEHGSPFSKIALRCPAVNMYEAFTGVIMDAENYEKLKKGKDVLVGFDRKVKVGPQFLADLKEADITALNFIDYAEDILILHGTKDEIISFDASRSFADENIIEFIAVENADHRFKDPKIMDSAIHTIIEFFAD